MRTKTKTAEQFFFDHAGYSYDPKTETALRGRKRCAKELAQAEERGRNEGLSFEWKQDDITSEEFSNRRPFYYLWVCLCRNANGEIVASLGGIDFGRNGDPWSDTYRRVVEAELASEYLAD